jgi:hypothetical protein
MSRIVYAAALCLASLTPPFLISVYPQTFAGTILGTVLDSSGGAVPDAMVTAVATATNATRTVRSDDKGYFELPLLPPGEYSITVEKTGFKKFAHGSLQLVIDGRLEVSVSLSPGNVKETVEVECESPLLETTSSSVSQVVETKQIAELPSSARNFFQIAEATADLLDIGAGAVPADSGSVAFGEWASNGRLPNTNEFMVDGATAVNSNLGSASILPSIDAIAEMKVQTNAIAAEFGRSGGAVMNIIYKSGTNDVHGSVYEFWKNRVLKGPQTNNWNASFFKNTNLREGMRLQFRAEFYNLFNHPIWAAPGASPGTSTFGVVAQKNGNRTGQLGLKLLF